MSRIGKAVIAIPNKVTIEHDASYLSVSGPLGSLIYTFHASVFFSLEDNVLTVHISDPMYSNMRGTARAIAANMVHGVVEGFSKKLLVLGVGYNAVVQGSDLVLSLGYSHKISYTIPADISIQVDKNPKGDIIVIVHGMNKQRVGQIAAEIRSLRKPNQYKLKGIRYIDEIVHLKATKTAKK